MGRCLRQELFSLCKEVPAKDHIGLPHLPGILPGIRRLDQWHFCLALVYFDLLLQFSYAPRLGWENTTPTRLEMRT